MSKINFSNTAMTVLEKRYLKLDKEGTVIETPEQLFRRVATAIGKTSEQVEIFNEMMSNLEFLPNSPTLMNAGMPLGMLSACFVLPIYDSIESIFDGIKHAAMIHKAGGGVGYSFSNLRQTNDIVKSTHGVASGPISFMKVYDAATETIKQGGKRRGANMGILHVNHPDIESFISCKLDPYMLTNFNISVAITDEFMEAVENDSSFPLLHPRTKEVIKNISAKELFSNIVDNAWTTGEPGIIFIDTINKYNDVPHLGLIESTNPCGEQPLLPYESCNLGSINLSKFVENGKLNEVKLKETVNNAVEFLDNVIDVNKYPLPQIQEMTLKTRKIGLGVMGFADMLVKMGIPYTSRKALRLAEELMEIINTTAREKSHQLGEEFGPYTGKSTINNPVFRNATRTTIAPTGSISIIAGCSSGIEPLLALSFKRRILGGEEFMEIYPLLEDAIKPQLSNYRWNKFKDDMFEAGKLTEEIVERYSLKEFIDPELFITSHEIPPEWHLKIQAAFQKHTDNAVSKTINLPKEATPRDIEKIYKLAWKLGLKGLTVYRDGSRAGQVISTGKTEEKMKPKERPETTTGKTTEIKTGCGKMLVTHNYDEAGNMFEVLATIGRCGGCPTAGNETTGRLISLCLRSGIAPKEVINQLRGISCPKPVWSKSKQVLSCADAIAQVLSPYVDGVTPYVDNTPAICPDCGLTLDHVGGCESCSNCGYDKCK